MSRSLEADHDERIRPILQAMLDSGQTEQIAVAECLDEIASNADDDQPHMNSVKHLSECASEIALTAGGFYRATSMMD